MDKHDLEEKISVIKEWRTAAEKEGSYFAKFALEYFAFNALLKLTFSPDEYTQDRNLIERLKGYVRSNSSFLNELKDDSVEAAIESLKKKPVKNLTRNGREIKIKNSRDWNNIIEAVYSIRNNLFHGEKQYSRTRDEKLVEAGYHIIRVLNECMIKTLISTDTGGKPL